MKLSRFVKSYSGELEQRERLDGVINFYDFLSKSTNSTGRNETIGVDTIVNQWIRQQFAFREQLVEDLITISRTVAEVAAPLLHIRNEVFRRGIKTSPKFTKKCKKCGKEFSEDVEKCDNTLESGKKCESDEFREPDEEQLKILKQFMVKSGVFGGSLEKVLKQFHLDVNSVDDGYLYIAKEYVKSKGQDGEDVIRSKPIEIRRLRPSAVDFDLDEAGIPESKHWLCVFHRDLPPMDEAGECKECHAKLFPAMYKFKHRGRYMYLLDTEVCHLSKFYPSETYGYSPLLTLFEKILTLIGMDKTLFRYFFERKLPAGIVMVGTDDTDSIRRARSEIVAQMRENPDYTPMVGYSVRQGGRGRVDFVKLFHTLQEMDYLPVRNEIRERVAAIWGLPPMWQSEYTGTGGMSGQSQQLVQFSRVVESDQRMFNEELFPFLMEKFGITDWKLSLLQPEEKAEATRIQFAQQRAAVAMMLKQAGFKVTVRSSVESVDDVDFKVSEMSPEEQQAQMGGILGQPQPGGEQAAPPQEGQEGAGQGGFPFQFSQKGWTQQILDKGYAIDTMNGIESLPNGNSVVKFIHKGETYAAAFYPMGQLIDIWKFSPVGVIRGAGAERKISMKPKQEKVFGIEEIKSEEDDD